MAEEKIGREAAETDQSAKPAESHSATRQESREYYDYNKASASAGEYYTTRESSTEGYPASTVKADEVVARSHDAAMRQASISAAEAGRRYAEVLGTTNEVSQLLDSAGKPMEGHWVMRGREVGRTTPEGFVNLTINQGEFDRLTTKTREILAEAALAQERIAKDQEEIDLLKAETREMLRKLRAA